jgi:hypothetical protein
MTLGYIEANNEAGEMGVQSLADWIVRGYAKSSIKQMAVFIDETAIYRDFPVTKLSVTTKNSGCKGGVRRINDEYIPCVDISIPYITEYTLTGFHEYDHIYKDVEIGSIEHPISWKHVMAVVLCHEMAHAVVNMHECTKKHGGAVTIPETYHSYSVDFIRSSFATERKHHGVQWQYTYRQLRNEFVNHKPDNFW